MHGLAAVCRRTRKVRRPEEQVRAWLQPEEEIAVA